MTPRNRYRRSWVDNAWIGLSVLASLLVAGWGLWVVAGFR